MKRLALIAVLCLSPGVGWAQVVVHQAALDQLAGIAPPAPVVAMAPPAPLIRHVRRRVVHRYVPAPTAVAFQAPPPPADLKAEMAPPPLPAAARIMPGKPAPAAAAKPAPALINPAPPTGVALTFTAGSSELPANTAAALKPVCAAAEPSGTVSIDAAAAGVAGDPSVAMRLSMQRAFAVRDPLAACGISPARIIPRALGPAAAGGNSDITHVTLGAGP